MVNNYATVKDTSPLFVGDQATVNSSFDLKRLGVSGNGNFIVSINPISSNISSVGNPVSFNNLEVLDEVNSAIQYTLSVGTQAGDEIIFELIVNNGIYNNNTLIHKIFGSLIPIFEDSGDSVTDNFDNNGWGTTTSTFVSPSSSITESPNGDYSSNSFKTITLSSPVDLTDAIGANITFYAKWDIENNWDYVQIEVSTNGGGSWIPQCGNYTNEGSNNSGQPTGEPLYDGIQNEWVLEEIDLSDYLGESILIRFQFESDSAVTSDGFYFDDLTVNVVEEGFLSVDDVSESIFSVYPNPVNDLLHITTPVNDYTIEIYNLQGQLIKNSSINSGPQTIDYSNFSEGIYLMKLTSENITKTFKIVKR